MSYLLHVDSSALHTGSVSRAVADTFRNAWHRALPAGHVVHRDVAAHPLPHLTHAAVATRFTAAADRTEEQTQAIGLQDELVEEFLGAGAYLFTVPMYNMSVPSSFKAWLDQIMVPGRTLGPDPRALATAGRPAVVITSRGGAYGPGTPREGWDHLVPYLATALGKALALDVEFVTCELTMAHRNPAMIDLRDAADASRAEAHELAEQHAQKIAARLLV
ncbi:FMN-dependent NADH-azoreductase [Streptomyces sp. NPDC059176]|uniref:FMN-dependent NADH-azoreductase n=1 Tax=unclassified Streptomyces TaxID=2593676 RepID=UPI0036982814